MQLPNNSEAFKAMVIEKIKTYCDTNIWPFESEKFTAWLANFDSKTEEYLALQILDSLIVRSYEMAKASYARLLYGPVRQYLIQNTSIATGSIQQWKSHLEDGALSNQLRLAPVRLTGAEGESGGVIYRMLSEELDTNKYSLGKAKKPPEVIILVDDMVGSGKQFIKFSEQFELADKLENTEVLYCPLIGFETGIEAVQRKHPKLKVLPAEYIYKSDSLFFGADDEFFKGDNQNTIADVKSFLMEMRAKYAPKKQFWNGFDDAGLSLAFEWGCPNQTLALLHMGNSQAKNEWQRLFSRRSL